MASATVIPPVPVFDGTNPKIWQHRYESYFELYAIPVEMWVKLDLMHFDGHATFRLQSAEDHLRNMCWEELVMAMCTRFGRHELSQITTPFFTLGKLAL